MSGVFAEHVRALGRNYSPTPELLADLARALRSHLHRKGLWNLTPRYCGFPDLPNWTAAFPPTSTDAVAFFRRAIVGQATLAELARLDVTLDCCMEAVCKKLDRLLEALEVYDNIDGLISLNLDRFLFERQRKQDPIGSAVYSNVNAVLNRLREEKAIQSDPPEPARIRNDTVIRFPGADATQPVPLGRIEQFLTAAPDWQALLPRMTRRTNKVQSALTDCVRNLPAHEISSFQVGELLACLKEQVRNDHRVRMTLQLDIVVETDEDAAATEIIRIKVPASGYSEREDHNLLLQQIRQAIHSSSYQDRVKKGMTVLFDELQQATLDGKPPSVRELARRFGLGYATAGEHMRRLRELIKNHRKQ